MASRACALTTDILPPDLNAETPSLLAFREAASHGLGKRIGTLRLGELSVEARAADDSVWVIVRRAGHGGLAVRAAYLGGAFEYAKTQPSDAQAVEFEITSLLGTHRVTVKACGAALDNLRVTTLFTPAAPIILPYTPRDLYPLDAEDDPLGAVGKVEAQQRGPNSGLLYFHIDEPAFGRVLYFQNFTALNGYFTATGTDPVETVGGSWPELGYLMPPATDAEHPLPAGVEVTLSDAILVFRSDPPEDERGSARQFLQMLGAVYRTLELPGTTYRDWVARSERTLRDLDEAPEATIRHYGHRYLHPYTASEYPDSMVQLSVAAAIHDWGAWRGEPHPLERELTAGLAKFYDAKLKTIRRYLPNVGKDKDANEVDSWYLYHPLLNLSNLALAGDEQARKLFFDSIDFGIKAAHHFNYTWPIQYDVTDFSVITKTAPVDHRGQTDVAGIYAWVMLQAFELSEEERFLSEARKALDAAMGLRFNLNYQANLTAWGAAACMRLWRVTNEEVYRDQAYVFLASFFHNAQLWESEIGHARHYSNFMAVTCLQDAPYMAMYECFETFLAFERFLKSSGPELDPSVRMLVSEYCRYVLYRAWYHYPDALPRDTLADEQRDSNGHIDVKLSFPVEDLYPDGQEAGQVGQEVYGAGAAFVFATRAFHLIQGAPFQLYCDHFLGATERTADKSLALTLDGGDACVALLSIVRLKRRKLPTVKVMTALGDVIRPFGTEKDRFDFHVPANGRVILIWE